MMSVFKISGLLLLALFATVMAKDPCADKDDGRHETKDVFKYMVCKNKRASYVSCGDNLYDPCSQACVAPWKVSMQDFCKCRENGNAMHPWNCHKYITCSNGYKYLFNCSRPELVYDPTVDRCVHPEATTCRQAHDTGYLFDGRKMTWIDAEKQCQAWGGHLATVTSQRQNDYLLNELKKRNLGDSWIGLNDIAKENNFVWVDGQGASGFINWAHGEPNGKRSENCVEFYRNGGTWNDWSCNNKASFICQRRR